MLLVILFPIVLFFSACNHRNPDDEVASYLSNSCKESKSVISEPCMEVIQHYCLRGDQQACDLHQLLLPATYADQQQDRRAPLPPPQEHSPPLDPVIPEPDFVITETDLSPVP